MMETGRGAGLAMEPPEELAAVLVGREVRDLQRHGPVELLVLGEEDRPHAPLAELAEDLVSTGEDRADLQVQGGGRGRGLRGGFPSLSGFPGRGDHQVGPLRRRELRAAGRAEAQPADIAIQGAE